MRFTTSHLSVRLIALSAFAILARDAVAAAGDLYIGDLASTVFRITPAGQVTEFAGGFDPYGIAFNAAAEGFAASSDGGNVHRIASNGSTVFADRIGDALGVAFGPDGNLYVADYGGQIWKIAPDGSKAVFASGIVHADGIAFDPSGNLFVTSYTPGALTKIAANGTRSSLGSFAGPVGVACDAAGNIFVAERDGGRISRFTPGGARSTFSTSVPSPYGLSFDAGGTLFVSDQYSGNIFRLDRNGAKTLLARIPGQGGFIAFEPPTGLLLNVSTRMRVLTGENVLIAGFILTGNDVKRLALRAVGPSLGNAGVADALQDPMLELHDSSGTVIASNDDWRQTQASELESAQIAPSDDRESAMLVTLAPAAYTAIVTGKGNTTGVGLVELYDLTPSGQAKLANISTRGFVDLNDNVMIAGFIVGPGGAKTIVRAVGPSLAQSGVRNPLADPVLALYDSNGTNLATNDNWKDTQQTVIEATTLAPSNDAEAAIVTTLPPGAYTAIVSGKDGGTGVGLVELYGLSQTTR